MLSESRARFEDQRPRREHELDDEDGDEELAEAGEETATEERAERPDRQDRGERFNRERRPRRDDREERGREARDRETSEVNGGGETIPFDVLPPAIGREDSEPADASAEEEPRRPRRRTGAARPAEGDDEVASPVA